MQTVKPGPSPAPGARSGRPDPLRYEVVDVFTDRPFAGNPLAVVFGADGLTGDQMQALAREFHLSETVFLLPPERGGTYRARIFTPEEELPFAGHPSVGGAVTAVRAGLAPVGQVVQECGAGLLPIQVYEDSRATLTGGEATIGPQLDPEPFLAVAGLTAADYAGPAPRWAGCGLEFSYLAVHPPAVARARGDAAAARTHGIPQVSVFSWDPAARTAHTRVFCPGVGVPEDPATGSAALGFGVWLVGSGLLAADGPSSYTVHQGAELLRPSTLECTVTARDGRVRTATVTGRVVPVARGEVAVPPPDARP
jgi:trans-2,3-dihydro-3-hydroxyanthranilate isomerase